MATVLEHPGDATSMIATMRQMPADLEAEQAVLGTILGCNDAMHHATELKPEHFHAGLHQRIWKMIQEFYRKGEPFSAMTLKHAMHEFAVEGQPGIEDRYLAKLVGNATTTINVAHMAKLLIELAMRRQIIETAQHIATATLDLTAAEMSQELAKAVDAVTQVQVTRRARDGNQVAIAIIEAASHPRPRTSTGMERLDKALGGGLRPGQAYGFAAPSGFGKTMLAGTISHNLDLAGKRHLFIAAEMGDEEIHARSLARLLNCRISAIEGDTADMATLQEAAHHANRSKSSVLYQHEPFLTFDLLKQIVSSAVATKNIEGVILDYWQLVRGWKANQKTEHLNEVADWIAAAAKAFDIWFIVTAQLNREGNVRDGDGLKMALGNLFLLHREDPTEPEAWLQMEKCRHTRFMHVGSKDKPSLRIHSNGTHYEEISEDTYTYSQAAPEPAPKAEVAQPSLLESIA